MTRPTGDGGEAVNAVESGAWKAWAASPGVGACSLLAWALAFVLHLCRVLRFFAFPAVRTSFFLSVFCQTLRY